MAGDIHLLVVSLGDGLMDYMGGLVGIMGVVDGG